MGDGYLTFSIALDLMRKGLSMSRLSWPSGQYVAINEGLGEFVLYFNDLAVSCWGFTPSDLMADDWLIHACTDTEIDLGVI